MGWLILWAAFRYKTTDAFEKALKYTMAGFYLFFCASTLKGRVEPNWTVPVFIPLIILSHQYLLRNRMLQRILMYSVPVTLLLVAAIRIYMVMDVTWKNFPKDEFHQNKIWAQNIFKRSGGLPVAFIDSYQKAAKYYFYAGIPAFSLNTPRYRRNNFNFWPIEDSFYYKKVAVVDYSCFKDSMLTPCSANCMLVADSFFSFSNVQITGVKQLVATGGTVQHTLHFWVEARSLAAFQSESARNQTVQLWVMKGDETIGRFSTNIKLSAVISKEQTVRTDYSIDLPKGKYTARYAMPSALTYDPTLNSTTMQLEVR